MGETALHLWTKSGLHVSVWIALSKQVVCHDLVRVFQESHRARTSAGEIT